MSFCTQCPGVLRSILGEERGYTFTPDFPLGFCHVTILYSHYWNYPGIMNVLQGQKSLTVVLLAASHVFYTLCK